MRSFSKILKESIQVPGLPVQEISDVLVFGLGLVAQFHVYHWQTKSYEQHKAFGGFYEDLQGDLDSLAEKFIGVGGALSAFTSMPVTDQFNAGAAIANLQTYRRMVVVALGKTTDSELLAVNDCLVEIQKLIDQTIYLLDLK